MKLITGAAAALLLGLASNAAQAQLNVFACVPEWGALANTIGGDRVAVTLATSALDNPESMAPTPGLISKLAEADLIACTGAGLEDGWLPAMLQRAGNAKVAKGAPGHFLAADYVKLIEEEAEEEEGGHHHLHGEGNPHIQGNPKNMQLVAAQMAKRLVELDPEGEAAYTQNVKTFLADMGALIKELEAKAGALRGVNIAVQHGHSAYFLNWLGVNTVATVEPEPGVAPGPQHLAEVIDAVAAKDIKFIVYAAYEEPGPSRYVAERAGIPVVKLPFTVGGVPEASDIGSLYRETVDRLLDGLSGNERS